MKFSSSMENYNTKNEKNTLFVKFLFAIFVRMAKNVSNYCIISNDRSTIIRFLMT
jgi:hypothetical protein